MKVKISKKKLKILHLDCEALSAGYPTGTYNKVPQKMTAIAWSWGGDDNIEVISCGKKGIFDEEIRAKMIKKFLPILEEANILSGHYLRGFDMPLFVEECHRLNLPMPSAKLVLDTMDLPKGVMKKGLDNLAIIYELPAEKMEMNWAQWYKAYGNPTWDEIEQRVASDVLLQKYVLFEQQKRKIQKPPKKWSP